MQILSPKILVVDDDPDICELLEYNFTKEGYEVKTAANGALALEIAPQFLPDIILMDIMMPVMDGIETGRRIRANDALKNTYLLFLTARTEEYSEIAAFDLGADDYITKPIKPIALLSRVKALLRRDLGKVENMDDKEKIQTGNLIINRLNHTVLQDGTPFVLPKKEFELLFFLAKNPDKVFGREQLLQHIWGVNVFVSDRTIDVHIRKLREKLGEGYIKTLKGVGYMFSLD